MIRRDFLKISAPLSMTPMMLNGVSWRAFATQEMLENLCEEVDARALVVIHLNGGNDGISSFVPVNQYDTYAQARPNIKLPQNQLSQLDTTLGMDEQVFYHPGLTDFKELYDNGKLTVVQGVSYPQPNKSHFKSRDLWLQGGDGASTDTEGWMARYLNYRYPNYNGTSFDNMQDPLGLVLGNSVRTGFHTMEEHALEINLSGQDPQGYYSQVSNLSGAPIVNIPDSDHGTLLGHIMKVENSVNTYAQRISDVFQAGSNSGTEYPNNRLADQLKTVARLLAGGCMTKVFMCNYGGFDTHDNQVESDNVFAGRHNNLLTNFSGALKAFQADLANLNQEDRVLTVVFSEFGRKVIENGNFGTDHGTLGPMFIVGKGVEAGLIGTNIDLSEEMRDKQGAPSPSQIQYDYRQVFGTLLQDWLGTPDEGLSAVKFGDQTSQLLPLVNANAKVSPECYLSVPLPKKSKVNALVLLEGFYDQQNDKMHNNLLQKGLFPNDQPYSVAPYTYDGLEELLLNDQEITDWVLLEVRDSQDIQNVLARKAAIIKTDGTIIDSDGSPGVLIEGVEPGDYYLAVFHKSHLAVATANPIPFASDNPPLYDFSTAETQALGNGQLTSMGGRFAMRSGDFDHNGIINNLDFNEWKKNAAAIDEYLNIDADGNGIVNNLDFNYWKANKSKIGSPEIQL